MVSLGELRRCRYYDVDKADAPCFLNAIAVNIEHRSRCP